MSNVCSPGDAYYVVPGSKEYSEVIGASEVATILGYGYESKKDLWLRKTHRKMDHGHKLIFDRGHDMEPIMARRLVSDYGRELVCEQIQYRDPKRPWLIYHADGVFPKWSPLNDGAKPHTGPGVWEGKAPGSHVAAQMLREGMTENYVCQGQTGMHVASAALGMPIVWATYGFIEYDSYELVVFDCAFNQAFMDAALPQIEEFYDCMVRDVPPEPIYPTERVSVPEVEGECKVFTEGEIVGLADRLARLKRDVMDPAKIENDMIRERLKELLDDYGVAEVPGVMKFTYRYGAAREVVADPMGLLVYVEQMVKNYNELVSIAEHTRNPTLPPLARHTFRRSDWVELKAPTRSFRPTPIKE